MFAKLLKRCLVLFTLSLSTIVNATQIGAPPLSEAVVEAKFIFDGTIIDTQTRHADEVEGKEKVRRNYDYHTFVINRIIKGSVTGGGKTVTVRQANYGGLQSDEIGSRYIMFLKNNGESMSPMNGLVLQGLVLEANIPPAIYDDKGEIVAAWFTPQGDIARKPDENTLRGLTKNLKEGYENQKNTTESIEHYFRVIGSDIYGGQLGGGILHPDGTWTLPKGAKPYDQDSYADLWATLIKREFKKQVPGGRLE